MLRVLVGCTDAGRAAEDLGKTLLWRGDVKRHVVTALGAARAAIRDRPSLALFERDVPWAAEFIREVREDDLTKATSIAVYAPDEMDPVEMDLLSCGANAVLRLPATRDWDKRLARLLQVPPRQPVRVPVFVEVEGEGGVRTTLGTSVNLSETGILIQAQSLEIGSDLTFAFRLPGTPDPVRGRARVVRMAADDSFGLEFSDISGESLQAICGFVLRTGF
jgi:PilZ domain-containing protein